MASVSEFDVGDEIALAVASPLARPRRGIAAVVVSVFVCYLTWLVVSDRARIDRAMLRFQGAKLRWLFAAVAFGLLSQITGALVQHALLRRAGTPTSVRSTFAFVFAQNAVSFVTPGGPVAANAYAYRWLRNRGTDAAVAAWALTAINLVTFFAIASFCLLAVTGISASGAASLAVLVVLLATVVLVVRAPARFRRALTGAIRVQRRVRRRDTADAAIAADRFAERLSVIDVRPRDLTLTAVLAFTSVAADCAVWIAASHAMITIPTRCDTVPAGRPVPAVCRNVRLPATADDLLAYASGQAATAVPFVPGGIGVVEPAMTAALTARHIRPVPALSAVLLYRLISSWAILLIGAVCWLALRRGRPTSQRAP